jgi:hypothetical protein
MDPAVYEELLETVDVANMADRVPAIGGDGPCQRPVRVVGITTGVDQGRVDEVEAGWQARGEQPVGTGGNHLDTFGEVPLGGLIVDGKDEGVVDVDRPVVGGRPDVAAVLMAAGAEDDEACGSRRGRNGPQSGCGRVSGRPSVRDRSERRAGPIEIDENSPAGLVHRVAPPQW